MPVSGATQLIDRRSLLTSAGGLFFAALSPAAAYAMQSADAVFASAYRSDDGSYGVATLTEHGDVVHRYNLPARGHDVVWSPDNRLMVVFARRPGTFAAVIGAGHEDAVSVFHTPEGRHFYGHGVFSNDGRLLYATENDYEMPRGVIGIYDVSGGFERIGELDSYGLGPHDLELLPDGRTLVVANGGLETHPDFYRTKLNIPTMSPNLSFIDMVNGDLSAQYRLPNDYHKVSIRHLTILKKDNIWFACQNEGDQSQMVPLVGRISLSSGDFSVVELPEEVLASLRGYVGSIAGNAITGQIAITSPRGHVAHVLEANSGNLVETRHLVDVCGVSSLGGKFCFSTGNGTLGERLSGIGWDNHLSAKTI